MLQNRIYLYPFKPGNNTFISDAIKFIELPPYLTLIILLFAFWILLSIFGSLNLVNKSIKINKGTGPKNKTDKNEKYIFNKEYESYYMIWKIPDVAK